MKLFKQSIGVMGILVTALWPALAAPVGSSQLSVSAGAAIPTWANSLDSSQNSGPVGGARYLHQCTSHIGIGGQFDYVHLGGKTQSDGALDLNAADNLYTGELVGRYTFLPDAAWVPYVHAGIGVARLFQTTKGTPNNSATWTDTGTAETRIVDHESSTSFALSYGGGVEKMLTAHLIGAMEATWNTVGSSKDRVGSSALNFPTISLRLGWLFGH